MIRVMGARVLVKRLPLPEKTEGGLFMLGREYPLVGEVLAVGTGGRSKKGVRRPITDLAEGDMVRFRREDLDTRQVAEDTFIIDYNECLCGIRREADSYKVWALGDNVIIKRETVAS